MKSKVDIKLNELFTLIEGSMDIFITRSYAITKVDQLLIPISMRYIINGIQNSHYIQCVLLNAE